VLVVGCIHGNECAGEAIVAWLEHAAVGPHTDLRLVPNLNPDGAAAGTRGDSRGVDLNRNFPWHWQRLGGLFDSGPRPLSERESRIAYRLILEYRPTVTIWFHQHEHLVDESGGSVGIEAHFARLAHLPLRQLPRYPGSVVGWENHVLSKGTAFVVELPRGSLTPSAARRFGQAVVALTNP
jgi:protein MpaA